MRLALGEAAGGAGFFKPFGLLQNDDAKALRASASDAVQSSDSRHQRR